MSSLYFALLGASLLVALGLVAGLYSAKLGFSHLLVFLVVGMLAGVDGPLGLPFDNHKLAYGIGNIALAMILLDGGLRTPLSSVRAGLLPAGLLASVGVLITAALAGVAAIWALDMDWRNGLLLGAVIASTDAAAVFSQLRNSGACLPRRLTVYPVPAGVPGAYRFFDVAFVVVLCSMLLQGPSLGWLARRLGLQGAGPPDRSAGP